MATRASLYPMTRLFAGALLVMMVAAGRPVLAQFGGMRMPGSRYPSSGYPPGYPQGQQGSNTQNNKVYGPTETLTGTLREISASDLVIDAGDDRIVLVQIQSGTKYLSTMDKVKASDFEPGDHVTVVATRDDSDHYYSKTITMNKKGTAEEKSAAMAANSSSHPGAGGGSSSSGSDSDPDRPRLHRTNPDASASAPTVTSPASSSDDSGPPVMRRSSAPAASPAQASSAPVSPAPVNTASASAGQRPSLSAEDVNGTTRLPVVQPVSSGGPADDSRPDRDYSGGADSVIDHAREAAFSFTDTLPNYVVKQITNRYSTGAATRGRTSWQPLDIVTTDLVYEDGKERYTNIMVNGKPTRYIEQTGSWSEGEFASMLQAILSPGTNAEFSGRRASTIVNRAAYRYEYVVAQPRSSWTLHADGQTYSPSYAGAIWIDKATFRVLRIEIAARNLPRDFPLDTAESSIDYDFATIGEQKVLLPSHAEALSCMRGTPDCTRNTTEFRDYKKYGAETNITFEGPADKP